MHALVSISWASVLRQTALVLALGSAVLAQPVAQKEPTPAEVEAMQKQVLDTVAALRYQKGEVVLASGLAKVALPEGYRYLDPKDSQTVLENLWGNPEGSGTLGMIVPANFHPLDGANWAAVLTFTEDGYVKDDDASSINYNDLLKTMKEDMVEANKHRAEIGIAPVELVGWAKPPHYDQTGHKLYWAKELKFGDSPENTLNYNIRALGRRGVLVINVVGTMPQLAEIEQATPALLKMVDFQSGHRYADFDSTTDQVANYGIAALVAGSVAAKAGFFKTLWIGILAFKKFIILGLIALAGVGKKAFDWARGRESKKRAEGSANAPHPLDMS